MCKISFDISDEILLDTGQSEKEALQFARRFTALSYYVYRGVSLGHAAQIADMDKESFIKFLSENKVSTFRFDDKKEFLQELNNA